MHPLPINVIPGNKYGVGKFECCGKTPTYRSDHPFYETDRGYGCVSCDHSDDSIQFHDRNSIVFLPPAYIKNHLRTKLAAISDRSPPLDKKGYVGIMRYDVDKYVQMSETHRYPKITSRISL